MESNVTESYIAWKHKFLRNIVFNIDKLIIKSF